MTKDDDLVKAAKSLDSKIDAYRMAHFKASDHLRVWYYAIGFLLIVLSAVVSGSVLQSTDGNPSQALSLATGSLSIAVVVLTSIQTTFKLGERGEQHRSAAAGFGVISRRLSLFINRPHPDIDKAWDELNAIAEDIGKVESGAPGFLSRTYDQASEEAKEELAVRRTR